MLASLDIDSSVADETQGFLKKHYGISSQSKWLLQASNNILTISDKKSHLSLTLDFQNGRYLHRNTFKSKEPLAQAVKIKKKLPSTLIDATPGVLKDALMLSSRGIDIIAIERNPLIYSLVKQSLECLTEKPTISYYFGDAKDLLPQFTAEIIYLDPMYPNKKGDTKKGAQVKKDMQILHDVVGLDDDAHLLFEHARRKPSRIVVKRPSYAQSISQEKPNFVSQTGTTRFDIYLPHSN